MGDGGNGACVQGNDAFFVAFACDAHVGGEGFGRWIAFDVLHAKAHEFADAHA